MPGRLPAAHAIVKLGIGADPFIADDQLRRNRGMGRDQLLQHRHDWIIASRHAENDFVGRIIEPEARAERFLAEIVDAAARADDGDARRIRGGRQRRRAGLGIADCNAVADQIEDDENKTDKGQGPG